MSNTARSDSEEANTGPRLQRGSIQFMPLASGSPTNVVDNTITGPVQSASEESQTVGLLTAAGEGVITGNTISGFDIGIMTSSGARLIADNLIENCQIGLYSTTPAEYRNNTIRNCTGDGVVLSAFGGSFQDNSVTGNGGAGIRLMSHTDLGGGALNSPGGNTIRGNGGYDLVVEVLAAQMATIFARNNRWTHTTEAEIAAHDIYDGARDAILARVTFVPFVAPSTG